jgi:hypothetical protein
LAAEALARELPELERRLEQEVARVLAGRLAEAEGEAARWDALSPEQIAEHAARWVAAVTEDR